MNQTNIIAHMFKSQNQSKHKSKSVSGTKLSSYPGSRSGSLSISSFVSQSGSRSVTQPWSWSKSKSGSQVISK